MRGGVVRTGEEGYARYLGGIDPAVVLLALLRRGMMIRMGVSLKLLLLLLLLWITLPGLRARGRVLVMTLLLLLLLLLHVSWIRLLLLLIGGWCGCVRLGCG